jgi:ribosomal-protein-alanine N-acetyltransferase
MREVLAVENSCFSDPWSEEDFIRVLRIRNCIAMVAEHDERVVGFMVYELSKTKLTVLNFGVHEDFRRRLVGVQLIAKLTGKLTVGRRNRIVFFVPESKLECQLFLKACGFECVGIEENPHRQYEDSYRFVYRIRDEVFRVAS